MTNIERVIVPVDTTDPTSWSEALSRAEAICLSRAPAITEVILLVASAAQIKNGHLVNYLGTAMAGTLAKGDRVTLPWGADLRLVTKRTVRTIERGVVIVFYADDTLLEIVDGMPELAGAIAVPASRAEVSGWEERWNPEVVGETPRLPAVLVADAVVENALLELTRSVNPVTSLLDPREKPQVEEVMKILRANGHKVERAGIVSWAIKNGWSPGKAAELGKVAERVLGMTTKPKLSGIHDAERRYSRW